MAGAPFQCGCGAVAGEVRGVPNAGLHLVCYCDSCRAGALHCGADLAADDPVDLYLTTPGNVTLTKGRENLTAFAFSPKGILRWRASCCGAQMFSSQPSPKTAFMSIKTDRFTSPAVVGPVKSKAFVPKGNGKTAHEGKGALAKLIFSAIAARLSGGWRKTPLYDTATMAPIAPVELISKDTKRALLAQNA